MDNPEGAQSTCDLKSEDEPKWPNDAVSEHPLEQPSRNESFVSLQTPNLPLDELEAYSMKSLEELDEIDELEARLGLRLMLINDVERASSLSNSQRPSLVIHIPLAVYE